MTENSDARKPAVGRARGRTKAPTAKGEERRREIVAAASELFARAGFRGTGMAEVAQRVGITEPGLLYHFGSKEGLLRAVVEHRDLRSQAFARDIAAVGGLQALREMPAFAHRNREQPGLAKLFAVLLAENLDPGDPEHDFFVRRYREMRAVVAGMIREGQRGGEMRADVSPELKAIEILAALDGIASQWLLDPEEVDLVISIEEYARTLIRDLATDPEPAETGAPEEVQG
ncbi:TetR/AcrR family transcriptional regulator [Embleya hyalina]|uniref:TetR family transcriptional regulator n=1 Tax=Embleya hyalina TaxID=516124 RepID=A0A401YPJ9_9ACTN|nr:TetR/AcrR family transcriptional regulator [Embleya hyalina]GCD96524.1 TetR family transcriptional regulator [Embleya hyalina]